MASRTGLCPCLSQTQDSIVLCGLPEGHDGLHEWRDPVHPGHGKFWAGNITIPVRDTRYRYESSKRTAERFGVFTDGTGRSTYAPMTTPEETLEAESEAVEFMQSRGVAVE